ncbi:hypothetical protein LCGC14_0258100 [marine sediment metagenome]|uniref:HhH-GPD domain-containing protein n=1 Tax=marine sediment metagenome TaxID=412755 RepID=A0A0F9WMN0_9ZZZZ
MTTEEYIDLKQRVGEAGYWHEIDWSENLQRCQAPCHFIRDYIFVVCNSGMKAQIARVIFNKVMQAVTRGYSASLEFGHPGKSAAIDRALVEGTEWFDFYQTLGTDGLRLQYLESLPWIGPITKWHLAKNLGMDCAKPDRHLVRIAGSAELAHELCRSLSEATGDRIPTVDLVIWRAANLGWM